MITITKQNDGVLFTFENSDKYLYGNGSILVPFNTLSIVADESDMITLKKAASNDVFISARYDTDLGYRSKDDAIDDLKDLLFAETGGGSGSGVTPSEVQEMIDESISGKADTSVVNQAISEATQAILSVSGDVQTKVATSDFNTYSAATATAIGNKQDALQYYSESTEEGWADIHMRNDDGEGNVNEYTFNVGTGSVDLYNYNQYDDGQGNSGYSSTQIQLVNPEINLISESEENGETEFTDFKITPTGVTINDDAVATEPYVDDVISGKVDTSAITSAITSASTNDEVAGAKAVYDAIQAGGGGVTVDQSLDTGSTNPVTNAAITNGFNNYTLRRNSDNGEVRYFYVSSPSQPYGGSGQKFSNFSINGRCPLTQTNGTNDYIDKFSLVETSAITTSITSSSTNSEVAGAKAVYDAIQAGGGGGATYSAGTNISIDTGNTINCTIPFDYNTGYDRYNLGTGITNASSSLHSIAIGSNVTLKGNEGVAIGHNAIITGTSANAVVIGVGNQAKKGGSVVIGNNSTSDIAQGVAIGTTVYVTGTTKTNINNQIWADTNNQVYIKDKTNTTDVCIQDAIAALGGLKLVKLTQSEYDQLATKDPDTLYIITNVVS